MRLIESHPDRLAMVEPNSAAAARIQLERAFNLTDERRQRLARILQTEIAEANSARWPQELRWKENLRQYEGIPRVAVKNFPIENAPNVELNVSGIVVDTLYAQSLDILLATDPIVRVRPTGTHPGFEDVATDIQILANRLATYEIGLVPAMRNTILDDIKHGTGFYYIPWTERVRYTDIARINNRGPKVFSPPLEDVLTPGGAEAFDDSLPWWAIRHWRTRTQLEVMRDAYGWDIKGAQTTSSVGYTRRNREEAGKTHASTQRISNLYDIWAIFGTFDVDGDGIERDLLIYYNATGNRVLHATWMPYDAIPAECMAYQQREHLIHGIGTVEMCSQFQEAATTILNEFMANAMLANTKVVVAPPGAIPNDTLRFRPGKVITVTDAKNVQLFPMSDVYPGSLTALSILNQMWERRTGVNEVSSPRPSSMLGNRTPGITAMTLMQAANRRFATAFDQMRDASAGAVMQALLRYHERLRMNDVHATEHIQRMFPDPERGGSVIAALKDRAFADGMIVEMQATSATANQIQDRQDMIQIAGILGQYYDKALNALSVAATQGIPEQVRQAAIQAAQGTAEIIKRTLSKFDQIRDADQFVLDLEQEINALPPSPAALAAQLGGVLPMAGGGGQVQGSGGSGEPSESGSPEPSESKSES